MAKFVEITDCENHNQVIVNTDKIYTITKLSSGCIIKFSLDYTDCIEPYESIVTDMSYENLLILLEVKQYGK